MQAYASKNLASYLSNLIIKEYNSYKAYKFRIYFESAFELALSYLITPLPFLNFLKPNYSY